MLSAALLIDGASAPAGGDSTFDRIDPVLGQVATRAAAATPRDAVHAANVAARAFPVWSATPPTARRACLERAAEGLVARMAEFTEAIVAETGGTRGWAEFNCRFAATILRDAAAMTTQMTGEVIPSDKPGLLAMAVRQPCGVVFSMAPWNAPVILATRACAMPLACGNTVVLKASELSPMTHSLVAEVLSEAGLPPGTINLVHTRAEMAHDVVEALIAHPAVRRINFTGSTRIGRRIAESAARHLKPCLLELGGKAPLIVLDDADIDAAVDAAIFGAFFHQGQICMSTERVIVDEAVADTFVARFADKARRLHASDPRDPDCQLGAMISEAAAERVGTMIADATARGARLACGGRREGVFIDPTIVDFVTADMRLYRDECFGPVAAIVRVCGDDEAISVANDSDYGLAAAVFSRDVSRALSIARRVESGICHINGPTIQDEPQMPFGGTKSSGYGRFGGKAGLDAFTELRWITIQSGRPTYPISVETTTKQEGTTHGA